MKITHALISASLILLAAPVAQADGSPISPTYDEFVAIYKEAEQTVWGQVPLPQARATLIEAPLLTIAKVCIWYEPGHYGSTPGADLNHYFVQVPVPDTDPSSVDPNDPVGSVMDKRTAGTYFIKVSFSVSSCGD